MRNRDAKLRDEWGSKGNKVELEAQMEQMALHNEILKQENHDISHRLKQSQLQDQLKMQYECIASYVTINELQTLVEYLKLLHQPKLSSGKERYEQRKLQERQDGKMLIQLRGLRMNLKGSSSK